MTEELPFDDEFEPTVGDIAQNVPGLARVAVTVTARTAIWGAGAYMRTGRRVVGAMANPHEAAQLRDDVIETANVISNLARVLRSGKPLAQAVEQVAEQLGDVGREQVEESERELAPAEKLRARGAELLDRSRDVSDDASAGHPAYARMLDEVAPDEARILQLLVQDGPQPSVDVRTGGPVGLVSSRLIAPGMTMLGPRAGLRYNENVPSYLNNLFRLGLVWLSYESLTDPMEYQVLEAQPDVLEAMHAARLTKVVRRSVHLTPFGTDFCRNCLVDDSDAHQLFPEHSDPDEPR